LWKIHLAILLIASTAMFFSGSGLSHPTPSFLAAIGFGLAAVGLMVVYPQAMFKLKARVLLVGPDGIETTVGKLSGRRAWGDVRSVSEEDGCIVLTVKNGNAFIVPPRAFASADIRADFLAYARRSISQ